MKYPNLKAIWSDSSFTDVGVAQAYTAAHKPIPFVTGDSSNAFLRVAKQYGVKFALSAYPPEQCGQAVNVVLSILHGQPVLNQVPPASAVYTQAQLERVPTRPRCTDNLWVPSSLPVAILKQLKLCSATSTGRRAAAGSPGRCSLRTRSRSPFPAYRRCATSASALRRQSSRPRRRERRREVDAGLDHHGRAAA